MSKVSITRSLLDDLAMSISAKSGEPVPLTLTEMKDAVDGIQTGGGSGGNVWQDAQGYVHLDDEGTPPITVEPLSVTQNGTYTATTGHAYSPVTVNVSGGGGGLEYEGGTFVPTEDVSKPTISFANTHTEPPMFAMMIDASATPTMETYTQYSFIYADWYRLSGTGFPYSGTSDLRYGLYRDDLRTSSTTSTTNSASLFTYNSDEIGSSYAYPSYYVTSTEFKPSASVNTDRYWRAGRTYKWIAVWAPTT